MIKISETVVEYHGTTSYFEPVAFPLICYSSAFAATIECEEHTTTERNCGNVFLHI